MLVVNPPKDAPYAQDEMILANKFVDAIAGDNVSQRDLAQQLDEFASREPNAVGSARFLDSGYFATAGSLREEDEFATRAILEGDASEVARRYAARERYDEFILAAPRSLRIREPVLPPQFPPFLDVVPTALYDERLGLLQELPV